MTRHPPGRKSLYPDDYRGDTRQSKPFHMDMTAEGRAALAALRDQTGLSRNNILAFLAIKYADDLTFIKNARPFPGKLGKNALSVRLPKAARKTLRAARSRTKHSYSDLGEALVRWYGAYETAWPSLPPPIRARKSVARPKPPAHAHHVITATGTQTFFDYDEAATALSRTKDGGVLVSSALPPRTAERLVALTNRT